jgi:DNA-binding response OmpR family regulator
MDTPPTPVSSGDGTTRVLIAHPTPSQALRLFRHLRAAGMSVTLPRGGAGTLSLRQIREQAPDVALLAVGSSGTSWDALLLARALRREPHRPGILLLTDGTCRPEELSLADDYVHEGCRPAELSLRVRVLMNRRRAPELAPAASRVPAPTPATGPVLHVLPESRRVLLRGRDVPLTMTEFDILHVLAVRAGEVVRKEEILDRVWRHDFDAGSNVVESHICTLRRKLADTRRTLISTVRGIGYRLTAPDTLDTASGQPSYGTGPARPDLSTIPSAPSPLPRAPAPLRSARWVTSEVDSGWMSG